MYTPLRHPQANAFNESNVKPDFYMNVIFKILLIQKYQVPISVFSYQVESVKNKFFQVVVFSST